MQADNNSVLLRPRVRAFLFWVSLAALMLAICGARIWNDSCG
jgi:hypothetical protein